MEKILLLFLISCPLFCKAQQENILDTTVYLVADEMPEFKEGGVEGLIELIKQNIRYPKIGGCVEGKVFLSFVIQKDGSVTNIKVVRGIHPKFDEEAIRILQLTSGKWKPARQNGEAVAIKYALPIRFGFID